jgi:hypothetical protein
MKQVIQLDAGGYFVGLTVADESPLEPGVFLIPAGAVDAPVPAIPEGHRAKWEGNWVFEDIPQPGPEPETPEPDPIEVTRAQAKSRLIDTDWAMLPDVNIVNRAEFEAYRAVVRSIYFSPVANPVWPERPEAVWEAQA